MLVLAALFGASGARAQKVSFEASAPTVVAVGEMFRVEFSLDAQPGEFVPPSFENIDVLAGPSESTGKSVSIINGQVSEKKHVAYTYVLQCNAPGIHTIGAAKAVVDGKTYSTKPVNIEAVEEKEAGGPQAAGNKTLEEGKATVAADDIILRMDADRSRVFKGQPVRVAIKLLTRLPLNTISGVDEVKYPSFNGFWSQRLSESDYRWTRETVGGRIYSSRVLVEYLLFPQVAGTLTVDPAQLTAIIQLVTARRSQSMFDDLFGGIPDVEEVRRKLKAQPLKITVRELPDGAPEGFSGAVGEFKMDATLPPRQIRANAATTYTVRISGSGNLPLVQAPELELPASFEQYNTKTTESLQAERNGITGYRQFEYPMIARAEGAFDIPELEFSYFDPGTARYNILRSPAMELTVLPDSTGSAAAPGIVSGISKEDLRILGQDIRFIKLGSPKLHRCGNSFMWSPVWWMVAGALCAAFAAAYVFLRRHLKQMRNVALLKGKRANKMALQRFRAAESHMKEGNQRGFYEEMLRALWGYLSDKLNMPAANLTKENAREKLVRRGVPQTDAERYVSIIGDCEYAQYAPARSGRMEENYAAGIEIVSKLDQQLGKRL